MKDHRDVLGTFFFVSSPSRSVISDATKPCAARSDSVPLDHHRRCNNIRTLVLGTSATIWYGHNKPYPGSDVGWERYGPFAPSERHFGKSM